MAHRDPRVDAYIAAAAPFAQPILARLRAIVHAAHPGLTEAVKWRHPCFLHEDRILCGMAAFKAHCTFGLWNEEPFQRERARAPQRAVLDQLRRMASVDDLPAPVVIGRIVKVAAALQATGVKRARTRATPRPATPPAYLKAALKTDRKAAATFASLSRTHKADYVEWLTDAKTEPTRAKRLATTLEWLAAGKTRNWQYERPTGAGR